MHGWSEFGAYIATEMRAGRTLVVNEVRVHPGHSADELAAYEAVGVRAYVAVPLVREGRILACLSVNRTTPHAWKAEEIALTEETAERTWAAVERARAEAALRESEVRQAFLLSLSDSLRPLRDPLEVQRVAVAALGLHLGVNRALYFEVQSDGDTVRTGPAYLDGVAALHPLQRISDFGVVIAQYRRNESSVTHDVLADPLIGPEVIDRYAAIDVRAGIGVPLLKEGRVVSIIGVHQAKPRTWTATDVALIEAVAERTWEAVERAYAEAAASEAQGRYQALFAASPVPFMVLAPNAPDFTITGANDAYFAATLTTLEGLVGRRLFDVFPEDPSRPGQLGSEALAISLGRVLTTRTTDAMERVRYDLVIPDGGFEPHWWEAINAPMLAASGEVSAIIHQVTRVTHLQYAEEAKRQEQEREAFLLKLSDALRGEPNAEAVSERALRMLHDQMGLDRCYIGIFRLEEDRGEFPHQLHDERLSPMPAHVRLSDFPKALEVASAGTLVINNIAEKEGLSDADRANIEALGMRAIVAATLRKGSNTPLWGIVAGSQQPRAWAQSEISLVEEVAERTWSAVERAHAEEAMKENDRRKDEFLAMLGHELRNPLAPIRMVSALLEIQLAGKSEFQPLLGVLDRQTMQLTRLVDDLLDVARLTHARVALKLECVECDAMIDQAIETVRTLAAEKSHELRIHRPDEKLYVSGDRARLVQTVTNVLHNAIKYTDSHGTITLTVSATEHELVLSVQDTGVGISAELLPHIFDLFVQSERSLDRSQGGLGIGLSVARHLVGMHKGSLRAHSAGLGQGSTFEIRLPRISAPVSLDETVVSPAAPRRILIVDDNRDAADTLALMLTIEGHDVDVVYRSTDALERVAQRHPDVVLLDLGMPEMDGYAVARALRADHGNAFRVIALTGYGRPEDRERSSAAGFDAHLVKPVDVQTLRCHLAEFPSEGVSTPHNG